MKKFKIVFLALGAVFISCQNDSLTPDIFTDATVSTEVIIEEAESVLDDISLYSESSYGIESSTQSGKTASLKDVTTNKHGRSGYFKDCAEIVVEEDGDILTTTITFTEGCLDRKGNVINGTIIKVRSETDTDAERSITIDNLSINGYVVNGSKKYTYTTSNANGNPEMTGTIDITVVTDEGTVSKLGSKSVEITAGGDTDTYEDDEKTITGSFVYTNTSGAVFSSEITTGLIKPAGCRFISSGVKEYIKEAGVTIIDYGDGACDAVATKTAPDGTVSEVRLGKKRHH
jgi:hypothetical protein